MCCLSLGLDGLDQLGGGFLAVALRVVVHPAPEVLAGLLHGELRLPVKLLVGQAGVGSQVEHVTGATVNNLIGKVAADDGAEGLDDLEDGAATAGSQVPGLDAGLVLAEVLKGSKVALGEIDDVDVVTDGSAVTRFVVYTNVSAVPAMYVAWSRTLAEDQELLALASGNLSEQGEQVEGDALGVLAHDAARVGATGVEVAEVGTVPLLVRLAGLLEVVALGVDVVGNDILDDGLGAAVGVGWADGAVLGDGDHVGDTSSVAVDGGGGGEDDVGDVVTLHGAQQGDATTNVDAVVLEGDLARLANGLWQEVSAIGWSGKQNCTYLEGGEVDDTVDGRVLGEDLVDGLLVSEVDLVEVGATAADQLNAVEGDLGGVVEVVDDDDIVAVLQESEGGEGANVAGSTGGKRLG